MPDIEKDRATLRDQGANGHPSSQGRPRDGDDPGPFWCLATRTSREARPFAYNPIGGVHVVSTPASPRGGPRSRRRTTREVARRGRGMNVGRRSAPAPKQRLAELESTGVSTLGRFGRPIR